MAYWQQSAAYEGPTMEESPYDITQSSNSSSAASDDCREDPRQLSYLPIVNDGSFSDPDEEGREEFPIHIERRQHCLYDEEIDVDSSASSDELLCEAGKIESGSQVLFGTSHHDERKLEVSHVYDEEHLVQSSSLDTSPSGDVDSTSSPVGTSYNRNIYNRHSDYLSSRAGQGSRSSTTAAVDDRIHFSTVSPSTSGVGTAKYGTLGQRHPDVGSSNLFTANSSPYSYRDFGRSEYSSNTVRSMSVSSAAKPSDVKVNMPDDDHCFSRFKSGRSLHKQTSSTHTRDGSPILDGLEPGQGTGTSTEIHEIRYSNYNQRPGYDDRYGPTDSLDGQHPGRTTNTTGSMIYEVPTTSSSHLAGGRGVPTYGATSTTEPNPELTKRLQKRSKKKESKKISWEIADGDMGKMAIDEILAFVGEQNSNADSGKKKKVKKRPDIQTLDRKQECGISVSGKKRDNHNNGNKKKQGKHSLVDTESPVSVNNQSNSGASEIIQAPHNNGLVSRIILNGSDGNIEQLGCTDTATYSERNIDEEIEQCESLREQMELDCESANKTKTDPDKSTPPSATPSHSEPADLELRGSEITELNLDNGGLQAAQPSQNTSFTYHIDFGTEPFWVEDDFVRAKTPEPVEVVHKKNKGHVKQAAVNKEHTAAVTHQAPSSSTISSKSVNKVHAKPKPVADYNPPVLTDSSNQRSTPPTSKMAEVVKNRHDSAEETHDDFSEKSISTSLHSVPDESTVLSSLRGSQGAHGSVKMHILNHPVYNQRPSPDDQHDVASNSLKLQHYNRMTNPACVVSSNGVGCTHSTDGGRGLGANSPRLLLRYGARLREESAANKIKSSDRSSTENM